MGKGSVGGGGRAVEELMLLSGSDSVEIERVCVWREEGMVLVVVAKKRGGELGRGRGKKEEREEGRC